MSIRINNDITPAVLTVWSAVSHSLARFHTLMPAVARFRALRFLTITTLAASAGISHATTIYTNEAAYLSALAGLANSVITEGFENDAVWSASRNSIVQPGSTPSLVNQGLMWASNHPGNNIATGSGAAAFGSYGIYSLPHGVTTDSSIAFCDTLVTISANSPCWQNDGWSVSAQGGATLYGVGGWFQSNTGGGAKMTYLLDGVDVNANNTDNIGNANRDGNVVSATGATFVGVIDSAGFSTAEILELSGKDSQLEFIFGDQFSIGSSVATTAVPLPAAAWLFVSGLLPVMGVVRRKLR